MTGADGRSALSLGVVWYRVPNEGGNDGKNLSYLDTPPKNRDRERFRECDEQLYDTLFDIVYDGFYPDLQRKRRNVQAIQEAAIFPPGTAFYPDRLTFDRMPPIGPAAREARLTRRRKWVDEAVDKTGSCHVVFLDPDNGLEIPSTQRHHKRGPKYVFYDEIARFLERGRSVVIYQHMPRESPDVYVRWRVKKLREKVEIRGALWAVLWHPYSPRVYFIIPNGREAVLRPRIKAMLKGPWGQHFEPIIFS